MDTQCVRKVFETLKTDQLIQVQTEKQELVGRCYLVDKYLNFIMLDVVKDLKQNIEYTSRQIIPAEMVRFLKPLEEICDSGTEVGDSSSESYSTAETPSNHSNPPMQKQIPYIAQSTPSSILSSGEVNLIQNILNTPVIIDKTGIDYDNALKEIESQQVIALYVEPTKYGRNFSTSIITVATVKTVYVFDMVSLGRLFKNFKRILESEQIIKAIHDSRFVADHFKYQHEINLNKIFDTFVAYCVVAKKKVTMDFVDLIESYFKINKEFFSQELNKHYPHNTFQRPLCPKLVRECVKRSYIILKLQEHLQQQMLSKFYLQCEDFSRTFKENDDSVIATEAMQLNKSAGFQAIHDLDPSDICL